MAVIRSLCGVSMNELKARLCASFRIEGSATEGAVSTGAGSNGNCGVSVGTCRGKERERAEYDGIYGERGDYSGVAAVVG